MSGKRRLTEAYALVFGELGEAAVLEGGGYGVSHQLRRVFCAVERTVELGRGQQDLIRD